MISIKFSSFASRFLAFWSRSIKTKLILGTIIAVFIPMSVTGYYFYINVYNILNSNIDNRIHQIEQQIQNDLDSQINLINDTSKQILSNPIIKEAINSDLAQEDPYLKVINKSLIEKQFNYILSNNYLWSKKFIQSISIIRDPSNYYCVSRNVRDIDQILINYDQIRKLPGESSLFHSSPQDATIYFVRNLRNLETMDIQGKIIIGIDKQTLLDHFKKVLNDTSARLFLLYENNQILFDTSENESAVRLDEFLPQIRVSLPLYEAEIDKQIFIMASKEITAHRLIFTLIFPKAYVFSELSKSMEDYLVIFAGILVASLFIAVFLSTRTLKPISALVKNINKVKAGHFNTKMPPYKERELNQVSTVFNNMTDEINHLITQVYEKQLLLKESELESLQAQINPHFLFNVLESISWEARLAKDAKAYTMITYLGQFLRANITMNKKEKVTIHEELQYIEFYLHLQKMRFGDKLCVNIEMADESIKDFYIPKLSIQPIIENAIIHGFESKRGLWKLDLSFHRDIEKITIEVNDNGIGFDTAKLNLSEQDYIPTRKQGHTSIGLYNSNKRIKLFYGESYGISVCSKINEGTKVTVKIPLDMEDAHV